MIEADRKAFFGLLNPAMEMYGRPLTDGSLAIWWAELAPYDLDQVRESLSQHLATSKFAPLPADVIRGIPSSDNRIGSDEAWAISLRARDESKTVVWTNEMSEAFEVARPLVDAGDQVAARMAFKEAYERITAQSQRNGAMPQWRVSLGWDTAARTGALEEAVRLGRIGSDMAQLYLPPPKDGGPIAEIIEGRVPQLPEIPEAQRASIVNRLRGLKDMLAPKEA